MTDKIFTPQENGCQEAESKARELYAMLDDEKYRQRRNNWKTEDLGEGMSIVEGVICQFWKPRYLMDHTTKCAYEFMDSYEVLCTVTQDDVDWESLKGLPEEYIERARNLDFTFPSFVWKYQNGVAEVCWQLNPDGRYWEDDDGYGMTSDQELNIHGFIDRKGRVLVKFRYLQTGDDWELHNAMRKIMREEAEAALRNNS